MGEHTFNRNEREREIEVQMGEHTFNRNYREGGSNRREYLQKE